MLPLLATLMLSSAPTPAAAVAAALAVRDAQADVGEPQATSGRGCAPLAWDALRAVDGSGRVALRFTGRDASGEACEGYAWASVRVTARALVTTRPVASGDPLAGAVALSDAEVRPGHAWLASVPDGAVAARALRAGVPLAAGDLRVGPRPGAPVVVVVRAGALELEQPGRAVPCARGLACALLPGGRRVEGRLEGGRLVVETP